MRTDESSVPEVFDVTDPVEWLDAWWEWWREQKRSNTQKRFKTLAQVAAGALPNVLARRYIPGPETIDAFNRVLKLDGDRLRYLQASFAVTRARTHEARTEAVAHQQELQRVGQDAARPKVPDVYLQEWENVVLREAARRRPLSVDPAEVAARFRYPPHAGAVSAAMDRLISSGLLVPHPEGWTADRNAVATGPTADGVRGIYRRALAEASSSLDDIPYTERELGLLVLSLRRADLPAVRARLRTALDELRNLADITSDPDVVYQLAVQVVPIYDLPEREPPPPSPADP
jgi:uncharacterized protein (TIGR02147 family)